MFDVAGNQRLKKRQDIVSRDAEQMIDSEILKAAKKKFCNGHHEDNSKLADGLAPASYSRKGVPVRYLLRPAGSIQHMPSRG